VGAPGAPERAFASSITQPPIAATAALLVLERSGGDREVERMLRAVVAGLERWHDWFLATATRAASAPRPSCTRGRAGWTTHPAGTPPWRASSRAPSSTAGSTTPSSTRPNAPPATNYDRYFFIVNERARLGFAPPRPDTEPLLVADVAITAILARAEEDLLALANGARGGDGGRRGRRAACWPRSTARCGTRSARATATSI
jgi:hypothetical protein